MFQIHEHSLAQEKTYLNSSNLELIRITAILTMLIDHIAVYFLSEGSLYEIMRVLGRAAMPLFAFGIYAGSEHTKDWTKYANRILLLAIFSQVVYVLLGNKELNVLFGLFFGLIAIEYEKRFKWSGLAVIIIGQIFGVQLLVPLFCWIFQRLKPENWVVFFGLISAFLACLVDWWWIGSLIPIVIIISGLGTTIRLKRWVSYAFYPVHLLIILIIKKYLENSG